MKSYGYGGRAGGGQARDYTKPVQKECWLHGIVDCDDCTEKGRTFGGYADEEVQPGSGDQPGPRVV